jgi:nucleoid-associated protein YgaU
MTLFDPTSRYYNLSTATYTDDNGNVFAYVTRRFLPQGEKLPLLVELSVTAGDRLDLMAHRTLGDPLAFWRIADANNALHPWDLLDDIGRSIRVPVPQPG